MKLSVVISTHNRAISLGRTLMSVSKLADEIIVVDNESHDNTARIAKKHRAKVFTRPNNLMLNTNKNFGFGKATGEWILCLDDDEEVTAELASEIKAVIGADDQAIDGYWIPRKNLIFGKFIEHGIWWPDRQLRLFRNGKGRYAERHVHEYVDVEGKTETLSNTFVHHNYDTIAQYLEKMQNIYTENEVQKYVSSGYSVRWTDAIRFPLSDFLKLYFAESGYKDGLHGLVLAQLQGFYAFIIFIKLWERQKFREVEIAPKQMFEEFERSGREIAYWTTTTKIRESKNPIVALWHTIRRKVSVLP